MYYNNVKKVKHCITYMLQLNLTNKLGPKFVCKEDCGSSPLILGVHLKISDQNKWGGGGGGGIKFGGYLKF